MKPWYKRKKVWTAVATLAGYVGARYLNDPELGYIVAGIGGILMAGWAAEDHGKASAHIEWTAIEKRVEANKVDDEEDDE